MTNRLSRTSATVSLALCAATVGLAACSPGSGGGGGGDGGSGSTKSITIQISGAAVPYYAPLYQAKEQGYFARQGLNVSFSYAPSDTTILQNVASGNVNLGFPNGDSVITGYGKGVKVKVVHTTYQQGIGALLAKTGSGITSPADLKGKTVAVTDLGSPNYLQLQAMLKSAGMALSDIQVKVIGTGAIVPALQNGQVDAIIFSRLRYYSLQAAGVDVTQILSDRYLPSFGNVVVASPDTVKNNPREIKKFTTALDQGIDYTAKHPTGAVDMAIKKYAPSFDGQQAVVAKTITDVFVAQLWNSAATKDHGLGYGDLGRWQTAINAQVSYKLIPSSFPAKDLVVQPSDLK